MSYDAMPPPPLGWGFREVVAWAAGRVGYCDVEDVTGREHARCTCGWAAESPVERAVAWSAVRLHVVDEHSGGRA